MSPPLSLHAEVPRDLNQPQQHSQLRAMGVVEPKLLGRVAATLIRYIRESIHLGSGFPPRYKKARRVCPGFF